MLESSNGQDVLSLLQKASDVFVGIQLVFDTVGAEVRQCRTSPRPSCSREGQLHLEK